MRLEASRLRRRAVAVALVSLAMILGPTACTLDDTQEQNLTGPADATLSVQLTADPDVVNADGVSQAVIELVVRDQNGAPVANKAVEFGYSGDGELLPSADSTYVGPIQTAIVMATDGNGASRVIWIAGTSPGVVVIYVRPYGIDTSRAFYRTVQLFQQ